MNRFITESEVEEAKKKRAEEWEAARSAGRELRELFFLLSQLRQEPVMYLNLMYT